jgi:hypothetical protein
LESKSKVKIKIKIKTNIKSNSQKSWRYWRGFASPAGPAAAGQQKSKLIQAFFEVVLQALLGW